jgi:predicted DNA-binding transcriptional regulator AlpA
MDGFEMIDTTREHLISLKEAAERLGVTTKTIYCWSAPSSSPRLETVKLGRRTRVTSLEAIKRFARQEDAPPPAEIRRNSDYELAMRAINERHG